MAMTRREKTIKWIVPNLRYQFKELLQSMSDDQVAEVYEDFELSEDCGNNNAKFPEWIKVFKDQQT